MTNRTHILNLIGQVMTMVKNSTSREQRFTLLGIVQILAGILEEVTQYEQTLITDLDVD